MKRDAWVMHWKRLWCLLNNINFQSLLFTKSLYTKRPIPCVSQIFHFNTFKVLHFFTPVHRCQPYSTSDSFQAHWYKLHSTSDWVKNCQSMKIFKKSSLVQTIKSWRKFLSTEMHHRFHSHELPVLRMLLFTGETAHSIRKMTEL